MLACTFGGCREGQKPRCLQRCKFDALLLAAGFLTRGGRFNFRHKKKASHDIILIMSWTILHTKYVFIYVEKKPLVYHQTYFFSGPAWLGISGNSRIKATEISEDAAKEDLTEHMDYMWGPYDEGRTIMESKVYEWCQNFSKAYPSTMNIYYEDEDFICYYFEQKDHNLFNLAQK